MGTNVDPMPAGWAIDDPVIRLRVLGSRHVFNLAPADRWLLGSAPECELQLDDPSGQVSRRHAVAVREGERWTLHDLGSTNGLWINHEARQVVQLVSGDELELGRLTLLAESRQSMALHALLQRWLGWSADRLGDVDRALGAVREMAHLRTALILRGTGPLAGVARRLHRIILGDRPFVRLDSRERGELSLDHATSGTLCVDAHALPRDMPAVIARLRTSDLRVRLVVCSDTDIAHGDAAAEFAAMAPRMALLSVPPLAERKEEIPRLLAAYSADAAAELGGTFDGFRAGDLDRLLAAGIATMDELEDAARRLVALRTWGVTGGAKRLGITHGALSRWARRRKIST
jgi:hypothetical protein